MFILKPPTSLLISSSVRATALEKELERRARDENGVCFEMYASVTAKPFLKNWYVGMSNLL